MADLSDLTALQCNRAVSASYFACMESRKSALSGEEMPNEDKRRLIGVPFSGELFTTTFEAAESETKDENKKPKEAKTKSPKKHGHDKKSRHRSRSPVKRNCRRSRSRSRSNSSRTSRDARRPPKVETNGYSRKRDHHERHEPRQRSRDRSTGSISDVSSDLSIISVHSPERGVDGCNWRKVVPIDDVRYPGNLGRSRKH